MDTLKKACEGRFASQGGLNLSEIKALVYMEHDKLENEFFDENNIPMDCICGNEVQNNTTAQGNPIKLFPCGHTWHIQCINTSIRLSRNQICFTCQTNFTNYYNLNNDNTMWIPILNNPNILPESNLFNPHINPQNMAVVPKNPDQNNNPDQRIINKN